MTKIFGAQRNSNLDDGNGPLIVEAWFSDRNAAELLSKNLPGICGARNDAEIKVVPVFGSVIEYDAYCKDELRRRALSKLTTEEKRALNLPLE